MVQLLRDIAANVIGNILVALIKRIFKDNR